MVARPILAAVLYFVCVCVCVSRLTLFAVSVCRHDSRVPRNCSRTHTCDPHAHAPHQIDLECGTQGLQVVTEPETCVYVARLAVPEVCSADVSIPAEVLAFIEHQQQEQQLQDNQQPAGSSAAQPQGQDTERSGGAVSPTSAVADVIALGPPPVVAVLVTDDADASTVGGGDSGGHSDGSGDGDSAGDGGSDIDGVGSTNACLDEDSCGRVSDGDGATSSQTADAPLPLSPSPTGTDSTDAAAVAGPDSSTAADGAPVSDDGAPRITSTPAATRAAAPVGTAAPAAAPAAVPAVPEGSTLAEQAGAVRGGDGGGCEACASLSSVRGMRLQLAARRAAVDTFVEAQLEAVSRVQASLQAFRSETRAVLAALDEQLARVEQQKV